MCGSLYRFCSVVCPYHHPLFYVWVILSILFWCMSLSSPFILCVGHIIDFVQLYVPINLSFQLKHDVARLVDPLPMGQLQEKCHHIRVGLFRNAGEGGKETMMPLMGTFILTSVLNVIVNLLIVSVIHVCVYANIFFMVTFC